MKILVTGGCGYVGSVLIPKLLSKGIKVINIDTQYFGNYLKKNKNLKNIKCNVNDIDKISLKNVHAIIHLASIANDPMAELDKNLSWETSTLGSLILINFAQLREHEGDEDDDQADEEDGLRISENDTSIAKIEVEEEEEEHHEMGIHIIGVSEGSTSFKLELMHGDHADFTPTKNVPITVNAQN